MRVCFTVDVEQDCPPYLSSWKGMEEGLPRLLDLLEEERVPATCFTTGEAARRFPHAVRSCVEAGHELGSHGDQHIAFTRLPWSDAMADLTRSASVLREFFPVRSFRAPYLKFPSAYIGLLVAAGFQIDSSEARYKSLQVQVHRTGGILRVPASITSSLLRWPASLRNEILSQLDDPIVLFVHPWEFVDLRRERLRWDCRFRTGAQALASVRGALRHLRERGAIFLRMEQLLD